MSSERTGLSTVEREFGAQRIDWALERRLAGIDRF
jgi:hypothetical protein